MIDSKAIETIRQKNEAAIHDLFKIREKTNETFNLVKKIIGLRLRQDQSTNPRQKRECEVRAQEHHESLITNEETKYNDFDSLRNTLETLDKEYTKVKGRKSSLCHNFHSINNSQNNEVNGVNSLMRNTKALNAAKGGHISLMLDL